MCTTMCVRARMRAMMSFTCICGSPHASCLFCRALSFPQQLPPVPSLNASQPYINNETVTAPELLSQARHRRSDTGAHRLCMYMHAAGCCNARRLQ